MAAVGVQQRFIQRNRIAQLRSAAAEEVETETFDVSWGAEGMPAENQHLSSSSGNSTRCAACLVGVPHGCASMQQSVCCRWEELPLVA
jgi:hypothetical protein